MRSTELKKSAETALQKRLRRHQIASQVTADLLAHCHNDKECVRAIGRRLMGAITWFYTGKFVEKSEPNDSSVLQQRLTTNQLLGVVVVNAAGLEDALEIGRLVRRKIEEALGDQRDLRLVC